jgi:hypothetical protein
MRFPAALAGRQLQQLMRDRVGCVGAEPLIATLTGIAVMPA